MSVTSYANLVEPMVERARHEPGRRMLTLIREDGAHEHFTALDLHESARRSASALAAAGVGADDVLVLAIGPLRELIEAFLGALYIGAVPTITSWGTDRLDAVAHRRRVTALVQSCAARAVVTTGDRGGVLRDILDDLPVLCWEDLPVVTESDAAIAGARRAPEDIAFLQFSSGTAGRQKAVPNTHRNVLRYLDAKLREWPGRHEVVVSWLPLYHDLGLVSGVLWPMVVGMHSALIAAHHWVRDPKVLFRAIHEYRGTVSYMPNFALNHCVRSIRERDLEGVDLSSWEELLSGGEPVRPESLEMFAERFAPYGFRRVTLRTGYGMAEMVEGVTVSPAGIPPRVDWIDRASLEGEQRAVPVPAGQAGGVAIVSCGDPMWGTEVRIADARGEPLPERAVGEVLIRSDYMFPGYYRQPDLGAPSFRDGWFCSGDLGYLAGGELYLTGRKSDLIIVGGRNLHPHDLELIADGVSGLYPGRSVAFGVADAATGSERIVMVCETMAAGDDREQRLAIERELRRRVAQELSVTVGDVCLVARGWVIKTSSGKTARGDNRRKYLAQFGDDRRDEPGAAGA